MDLVPAQVYVAIGAIVAALIAGAFSYFNLVSAKETKVSEFRQAWIDALRSEISTYVSRLVAVTTLGEYIHTNLEDTKKYDIDLIRERSRHFEEILAAHTSIRLRINRHETDRAAKRLNDSFLSALSNTHDNYTRGNKEALSSDLVALSDAAAPLLKFEWNRVRDGEPVYRHAKRIAIGTAIAALVAVALLVWSLLQVAVPRANAAGTIGGTAGTSTRVPASSAPPAQARASATSSTPNPSLEGTATGKPLSSNVRPLEGSHVSSPVHN